MVAIGIILLMGVVLTMSIIGRNGTMPVSIRLSDYDGMVEDVANTLFDQSPTCQTWQDRPDYLDSARKFWTAAARKKITAKWDAGELIWIWASTQPRLKMAEWGHLTIRSDEVKCIISEVEDMDTDKVLHITKNVGCRHEPPRPRPFQDLMRVLAELAKHNLERQDTIQNERTKLACEQIDAERARLRLEMIKIREQEQK